MRSYLMVFFVLRSFRRVYQRNYTLGEVEMYLKMKPTSSLQSFIEFLSRPNSISYVVFVCVVSAIGVFGEYV